MIAHRKRTILLLLAFSFLGFAAMGYHPGAEDDGVYLTAVKADLDPSLFPHDADFFQLQMHTSIFDNAMAFFVRWTGIPVPWAELFWQWITILGIVMACWGILRQIFPDAPARWGGVAMVTAMFTLPVAGTALYILDQHLHARSPATALILFAISSILARRQWLALPLCLLAFLLHPLMGAMGIAFCGMMVLTDAFQDQLRSEQRKLVAEAVSHASLAIPFGWVLDPPSETWLNATRSTHFLHLFQWEWYEWLGAIAPILLFWGVARVAHKRGETNLARLARAILAYSIVMQALALALLSPGAPIGLITLEPMRYLHLVYIFLCLIGGAYLGRYLLGRHVWRWAVFLLVANGGMFLAQRQLFASSPHLELPFVESDNSWLQAFDWIRYNTPKDAYFALDPRYVAAPGEDYHNFRALAERSMLADAIKDKSVVTKLPELGARWHSQQLATAGWEHFQLADFERLKAQFGVTWALVSYPPPQGLACRWHDGALSVCQIP